MDLAVTVHLSPQQTGRSVRFWMGVPDGTGVKRLVVVDHDGTWRTTEDRGRGRHGYWDILRDRGWVLLDARPKFETAFANQFVIYPEAVYALFARA